MTRIVRLGGVLLLISAALPFVTAGPGKRDESSCKSNEFWFPDKNCCLPEGGPSSHPKPPSEKQCPSEQWSWSKDHDCCIPHHQNPPPPRCPKNWDWDSNELCCKKHPPRPKPSGGWKKRAPEMSHITQCPMGLHACPITSVNGPTEDFECLDTANELESCGGCASIGEGQDCAAIKGAWNVACEQGSCTVYTCSTGYKRSRDGKSCIHI